MKRPLRSVLIGDVERRIARLYAAGFSTRKVARLCGVSQSHVCQIMKRRGIQLRSPASARRRLSLDESAFNASSEAVSYWVGFLMADGGIVGGKLRVDLQARDKGHLVKFQSFLKAQHRIRRNTQSDTWRFVVSSRALVTRLAELGVTECKSFTACAPRQFRADRHFWRGVIDGDGSIGVDRHQRLAVQLATASRTLLDQYRAFLRARLGRKIARNGSTQGESAITVLQNRYRSVAAVNTCQQDRQLRVLYDAATVYLRAFAAAKIFFRPQAGALYSIDCQRRYPWRTMHVAAS